MLSMKIRDFLYCSYKILSFHSIVSSLFWMQLTSLLCSSRTVCRSSDQQHQEWSDSPHPSARKTWHGHTEQGPSLYYGIWNMSVKKGKCLPPSLQVSTMSPRVSAQSNHSILGLVGAVTSALALRVPQ